MEDVQKYSFVSFADPDSGENLGCCILECSPLNAVFVARHKGIDPGGEAKVYELTEEECRLQGYRLKNMELDHLYTPKEMDDMKFRRA